MLDQLPVEIVECIVAKIPDTDLIAVSKVDRVLVAGSSSRGYKRWKIMPLRSMDRPPHRGSALFMEKCLKMGWSWTPKRGKPLEHALSEHRWGGDPWRLGVE
ncbi:hypothetical protein GLOIN_2v1882943 [Rhizophagus irregularis DAOM 181602=DAOM 197198]|nr:hypothetical protein GLOIN_2v1882943 [Rhizophagus irregularis DAOM 181602=DAOM 197198]